MMDFLIRAIVATLIFFLVDMVWLTLIAKKLYAKELKDFLSPNVNWLAALIFYLVFIFGMTFFVITPAIADESLIYAIFGGAFFGFVCYATYDLTNLATMKNWPIKITVIDLIWGSFVSSITCLLTYIVLV